MGYLNEYPHWEANDLNLDWLLEQYSTFNERLQELHNHFDEAVERMEGDIENFETEVNSTLTSFNTYMTTELNQIRTDFNSYVTTVNERFDELSEDIQEQTTGAIEDIQRQIDAISSDIVDYLQDHMSEWQLEAYNINYTISNDTLSCDKTLDEIYEIMQSGNVYKFKCNNSDCTVIGRRGAFPVLESKLPIYNSNDLIIGYTVTNIIVADTTYSIYKEYIEFTDSINNATSITLSNRIGNGCDLIIDYVYRWNVDGGSNKTNYYNVLDDSLSIYTISGNCVIDSLNSNYSYLIGYHFIVTP